MEAKFWNLSLISINIAFNLRKQMSFSVSWNSYLFTSYCRLKFQINEILSKKKKLADNPKHFLDGDRTLTENTDIANCFNNFFSNIGPTLANSIKSPINKSYKDYLKQNIISSFSFDTVTPELTAKIIRKLKSKSSSGHDGLSSIQLKYISDDIINILTHIINQSLCTGIFPTTLKIAKITPILKKETLI